MGRTGHLFACEADGVSPDILCIAKGLDGGYQPIGAMLCSGEIYKTIEAGSGNRTGTESRNQKTFRTRAMANGLICYPMSGTIDGQSGDHILLAPPYILEEEHIEELVTKLNRAILSALGS